MNNDSGKGKAAGIVVKLVKGSSGQYLLPIPKEITDELEWELYDKIDVEETMMCETWGEIQGVVLRNLTKERK